MSGEGKRFFLDFLVLFSKKEPLSCFLWVSPNTGWYKEDFRRKAADAG